MPIFVTEYPQFFAATNLEWKKLLQPDKYKDIIISSFRFLVEDKRIKLYAFVIMSNHIHLIWQMQPLIHPQHVQRDFLKYTAQKIKHDLRQNHPAVLERFRVNATDREYQLWERNPLSIELRTDKVYRQKLDYSTGTLSGQVYASCRKNINILPLYFMKQVLIIGDFFLTIGTEYVFKLCKFPYSSAVGEKHQPRRSACYLFGKTNRGKNVVRSFFIFANNSSVFY